MQVQIDIGFEQLVQIAKKLPLKQWAKLKDEVEKDTETTNADIDMVAFLMSAPTFTEDQLDEIEKTRKSIGQWRKK